SAILATKSVQLPMGKGSVLARPLPGSATTTLRRSTMTAPRNLQEKLDQAGNAVDMLRNNKLGAYIYPVVPAEFTNWRREQRAWREPAVLFDQSHHMDNLFLKGPGAIKLLSDTMINSPENFPVDTAKQLVPVASNGGVVGDGILFREADDEYVY